MQAMSDELGTGLLDAVEEEVPVDEASMDGEEKGEAEEGEEEDGEGMGDAEEENEAATRNNLQERYGARAGKGKKGLQLLAMATAKGILKKPAAAKEGGKGNGKAASKGGRGRSKGGKGKGAKNGDGDGAEEAEKGGNGKGAKNGDGDVGGEAGKLLVLISCSTCCVLWFL